MNSDLIEIDYALDAIVDEIGTKNMIICGIASKQQIAEVYF
jgi:hypothetical protein